MSTRSSLLIFGVTGLFLAALPVAAQQAHKTKSKARGSETATIVNTASTNTTGYQIILSRTAMSFMTFTRRGEIVSVGHSNAQGKTVIRALAAHLFQDLTAAMPFSRLPARKGMRSASFGSETYIMYQGQRSPDLTLPGNEKARALLDDTLVIAKALNLGGSRHLVQETKPKAAIVETATIENTGSTNTKGYNVSIKSDGTATSDDQGFHTVSKEIADKFFQDLHDAQPLSSLPVRHGMRSVSFGTSTFITYNGQQSPYLTFGGDPRADALKADIAAITQPLHIRNQPRFPLMRPITP